MKLRPTIIPLFLCTAITGSAFAQNDRDADEIDRATKLITEVSRVYSEAPALVDVMQTRFVMEGRADEVSTIRVRLEGESVEATGMVPPQTLDVYAVDDFLYFRLNGVEGVGRVELGDEPLASAREALGMAYPYLPPQVVMRWSTGDKVTGNWFTLGMLNEAEISGMTELSDGPRMQHEVLLRGTAPLLENRPGTCRVRIDDETRLIQRIEIEGGTDGEEPTFRMTAQCEPKILDELDTPIAFTASDEDVKFVSFKSMLSVLLGGGVSVDPSFPIGAPAPEFDLVDHAGNRHKLSDYRGRVVVLDWWGVWCIACRRDLPGVQKLAERYAGDDRVVFLAMDVGDDNDRMSAYWAEQGFTFPSLQDADELAGLMGVRAYPSVIVIGRDGTVLHTEAGSAGDLGERLEELIESGE